MSLYTNTFKNWSFSRLSSSISSKSRGGKVDEDSQKSMPTTVMTTTTTITVTKEGEGLEGMEESEREENKLPMQGCNNHDSQHPHPHQYQYPNDVYTGTYKSDGLQPHITSGTS